MEMERQRRRRKEQAEASTATSTASSTATVTPEALLAAREGRHPMGRVRDWMIDFGVLGAVTGLAAAITHIAGAGEPLSAGLPILAMTPLFLGLAATLAGAVAGGTLRALRGKVPAALGVLLSAMAVNFTGSFITLSLPWQRFATASIIEGKAAPLSLAVLLLIPVVAVFRWRKQSTLPWLTAAGALAGVLIGLS